MDKLKRGEWSNFEEGLDSEAKYKVCVFGDLANNTTPYGEGKTRLNTRFRVFSKTYYNNDPDLRQQIDDIVASVKGISGYDVP